MKGRSPFLLRLRSSTIFITLIVWLGGIGFHSIEFGYSLMQCFLAVLTDVSGYGLARRLGPLSPGDDTGR